MNGHRRLHTDLRRTAHHARAMLGLKLILKGSAS